MERLVFQLAVARDQESTLATRKTPLFIEFQLSEPGEQGAAADVERFHFAAGLIEIPVEADEFNRRLILVGPLAGLFEKRLRLRMP